MEEQTDNKNLPTVKILISYHKPAVLLKDEVLTPIHVGRALATESSKDGSMSEEDYKWMLENMIGDDTGDNISHLNRTLNELTSMYWAWKNYDKLGNPDYIGFMHYRRHLNFNIDKKYKENEWGLIDNNIIDENYIDNYHLKADYIKELVGKYDILVANKWNVNNGKFKNNYDVYKKNHKVEYYDKALSLLEKKYPNYKKYIKDFNSSKYGYYTNIFIMKKEIFFRYCEWLFDIILKLQNSIDINFANYADARAWASERLFNIYLLSIIGKNYKILELQRTFVHNLDITIDIRPKFENGICICFSSDNNYAPYLAVTIKSLIENSSSNNYYEIYIIDENISKENKTIILSMCNDNFYIRFIKIIPYLKNMDKSVFFLNQHFTISTYYRFFIPDIFKNFNKILYLDSDILVLHNLAELYYAKTDKMIAACHDTEMIRCIYSQSDNSLFNKYLEEKLKMKNPYDYFQAGVLLFNIKELIRFNFKEKCINKLTELKSPIYVDQCVLNSLFDGDVDFIDLSWNIEWQIPIFNENLISKLPDTAYKEFMEAYDNPKLIHYAGYKKPWTNPNYPKSNLWWKYARMTDFYEEIIYKNCSNNIHHSNNNRFSIADFILSVENSNNYFSIMILGIKISIKKKSFVNNKFYESKIDRVFSIYKNNKYMRITIFGFKIILKNKRQ